jgi:hypothetical protein
VGSTVTFDVTKTGEVIGTYSGPSSATATLSGTMDCKTLTLSVQIENGTYSLSPYPGTVSFSGTLTGTYDNATGRFVNGTWTLKETSAADGGTGPWTQQ